MWHLSHGPLNQFPIAISNNWNNWNLSGRPGCGGRLLKKKLLLDFGSCLIRWHKCKKKIKRKPNGKSGHIFEWNRLSASILGVSLQELTNPKTLLDMCNRIFIGTKPDHFLVSSFRHSVSQWSFWILLKLLNLSELLDEFHFLPIVFKKDSSLWRPHSHL